MSSQPDVVDLYARAVARFVAQVRAVPDGAWGAPTPCDDWDVHTLVNHVVGESRWVEPLVAGRTIDDVGQALDGDLLGSLPGEAAEAAGKAAVAALGEAGALERTVHLSFGDTTAREYAWQVMADHVVHTWDLAVATGGEPDLDDDLVAACATWWKDWEDAYRSAGAVGARVDVPATAHPLDLLVAAFGRDPAWTEVHHVVRRFGAAWEAWDLDAIMALMAEDAVFESTGPAPDGRRVEGRDAIRAEWQQMFSATRDPSFTFEEAFVSGDRATARWRFGWTGDDGTPGHVRGADVMRVRDGKVVEKLSYVKG
jgi:uncharacterized protein (TIGR03086 family)